MSNFSDLEYEFMNQESNEKRQQDNYYSAQQQDQTNQNENASTFSCVIDRARMIKYSSATSVPPSKASKIVKPLTITPAISSNMNLFYELMQSMPEISKLQIR